MFFKRLKQLSCSKCHVKGVVYDSGESLLIFELNSQTNIPLSSVLFQTCASNSQHEFVLCTSLSCDILYEVFSGSAAKTSVFDNLGCFLFTDPGLCMTTRLFFQRTHRTES